MREIPLHSRKYLGLVSLVDDEDFDRVNQHRWNVLAAPNGRFYAKSDIAGRTELMHRFILGVGAGQWVDHWDHDGLNNQKFNIRSATASQNAANSRAVRLGSSSFKGVVFDKRTGKWLSRATFQKRSVHLGVFELEVDAAKAYNAFALEHHGEFACLNDLG